jgi:hypothetical protein
VEVGEEINERREEIKLAVRCQPRLGAAFDR